MGRVNQHHLRLTGHARQPRNQPLLSRRLMRMSIVMMIPRKMSPMWQWEVSSMIVMMRTMGMMLKSRLNQLVLVA